MTQENTKTEEDKELISSTLQAQEIREKLFIDESSQRDSILKKVKEREIRKAMAKAKDLTTEEIKQIKETNFEELTQSIEQYIGELKAQLLKSNEELFKKDQEVDKLNEELFKQKVDKLNELTNLEVALNKAITYNNSNWKNFKNRIAIIFGLAKEEIINSNKIGLQQIRDNITDLKDLQDPKKLNEEVEQLKTNLLSIAKKRNDGKDSENTKTYKIVNKQIERY